ncbi:hypothetical protein Tco_1236248 [Tanacetum coccineum]
MSLRLGEARSRKKKSKKKPQAVQGKGHENGYVGNGNRAAMEAKGSFDLILPNGLVIVLDNSHSEHSITRDNGMYSNAIPRDGIYEIDMHNLVPNDSSMYSISNKISKHNLDSTFLWHCLGHMNKNYITKF